MSNPSSPALTPTPLPGGVPEWSDRFSAVPLLPCPMITPPSLPLLGDAQIVDAAVSEAEATWSSDSSNDTVSNGKGKGMAAKAFRSTTVSLDGCLSAAIHEF
jgi:hypothetical protein